MNRLLAVLLALCLVGTGCSSKSTGKFIEAATPSPTASDVSSLPWKSCIDDAEELLGSPISGVAIECAKLPVSRDWTNPSDASTIDIALMRVRHKDQKNRIGSLLVNPGGPGGSGRQLAAAAASMLPKEILTRFDIVGFDPRGVGASAPVRCLTDKQKDEGDTLDPDPVDQAAFDANVAYAQLSVDGCMSAQGAALRVFSTEQTARDMDAIRQAVGDEKLSYLGFSYGTLLGAVYAHLFPTRIRAMVLDGAVDPQQGMIDSTESQAIGFEKAFEQFAKNCGARGPACKIGPDARATVERVLSKVREQPVLGDDDRPATESVVFNAIVSALYSKEAWPVLEQALSELEDGKPEKVFSLADAFAGRDPDGRYNNMMDANTVLNCVDSTEESSVEEIKDLRDEWDEEYPLFGSPLAIDLLTCALWPAEQHDAYPMGAAAGAPPIVVVGTTGDPATPYENTERLATILGTGVTLTWEGEGHTAYPTTKCIRNAVDGYLINLIAPADGTRCT